MDELRQPRAIGAIEPVGTIAADAGLAALAAPALDPLFARPTRIGVPSAWYGHVPFARWIVRAARPGLLVELGTHAGASYAAFCDAVLAEALDTRCYAVDTWQGDEHAGFYDETVYESFRAFHDARYGGFSRLIRARFADALGGIADASVDLLHIDGRHRTADVAEDFSSWLPKLSSRAVVLFHDTNMREGDFGVWRHWRSLRGAYPAFEFLHGYGLGVLLVGSEPPPAVAALCGLRDPRAIATLRERFALLGERWELALQLGDQASRLAQHEALAGSLAAHETAATAARAETARLAALHHADRFQLAALRNERAVLGETVAGLEAALAAERSAARGCAEAAEAHRAAADARAEEAQARAARAEAQAALAGALVAEIRGHAHAAATRAAEAEAARRAAVARAAVAEADSRRLQAAHDAVLGSLSWRVTFPLRAARRHTPMPTQPAPMEAAPMEAAPMETTPGEAAIAAPPAPPAIVAPAPSPALPSEPVPPSLVDTRPRILFVCGEPETPGYHYRVLHPLQAAAAVGWRADRSHVAPVGPHTLAGASIVVLWRTAWSPHVQGILDASAAIGARVLADVDDLVFRPELARIEVIDGIRTTATNESESASLFAMISRTLAQCEMTLCTTEELAGHVRACGRPAVVIPNGFDDAGHALARRSLRAWTQVRDDLVRIGYAGGSRTHQRDFRLVAAPLAAVLRSRPETRLILFRDPRTQEGLLLLHEFPELAGCAAQIEWRDMVALPDLPRELARFDVNLAPLETGNVFCEAKSELKYFEAALVDAPTVASPTGPLRRAIRHGETGFLADGGQEWHDHLLALVDDPALRRRVGKAAYHDALWRFGPRRREELWLALLRELQGGDDGARAFELGLHRAAQAQAAPPHLPSAETLFEADALGEAEVTVIVPVYNYAEYVLEALESVSSQRLAMLDLVVVDDASTDSSPTLVVEWARHHAARFNRLIVRRHHANAGLGFARNSGFAAAETPFVLPLDADNRLHPACCASLAERLRATRAAFVYPSIRQFGDKAAVFGDLPYAPSRLMLGNYIDAMALVAKWAWAAVGGYDHVRYGWEDYDFWCRLAERGLWGEHVPHVLADYRVHKASMLAKATDPRDNKRRLIEDMHRRHAWLRIPQA